MSASKFFLCRSVLSSNLTFLISSKCSSLAPKTFTTLNCIARGFVQKHHAAQSFKILSKPPIKFDFLIRRTATTVTEKSAAYVQKQVGLWLLLCSCLVYGTIVAGGYTRLTESGLSMVTWRFTFESFPTNEKDWLAEFQKYQEYPEFKLLKKEMTLEEFKKIWITEYIHRNWGRGVGLAFLLPALTFWIKGCFKPPMKKRIVFFGSLIVAQGLLGWYMVKSGLEDRFHKEADIPRVSQYRLAAHLGLALTLYTGLLLTTLDLLLPIQKVSAVSAGARKLRMLAHSCKGLVFLTALSGALVAGLDAGLVYNSFPKMGDSWIPDDIFALSPVLKNFTENPTTVQFDHRVLGITTFSTIMATWLLTKRQSLPRRARIAANALALGALCQVSLGISTLVHCVPTHLAISHQTGVVFLRVLLILQKRLERILIYCEEENTRMEKTELICTE